MRDGLLIPNPKSLTAFQIHDRIGLLIGGQALAVLTGLASGETEPTGWPWALVLATIAGYTLTLVALGIAGVLLVRDRFRRSRSASADR